MPWKQCLGMCTRSHSFGCSNGSLHPLQVPALQPHHELLGSQVLFTAKLLLISFKILWRSFSWTSEILLKPYPPNNFCNVDLDQPTSQAQAEAGGCPSSNWHPEAQLHSATNLGVKPVLQWQQFLELRERRRARHSHRCCFLTPAKIWKTNDSNVATHVNYELWSFLHLQVSLILYFIPHRVSREL